MFNHKNLIEMHFPFHCFKSTPCALNIVEIFSKMDETRNHQISKRLTFKKVRTEQTNTCSKTTIETREQVGQ